MNRQNMTSQLSPIKFRIIVKAYDSTILVKTCAQIMKVIKSTEAIAVGPITLPTKLRRYCVLTSPHVNKKARDHFEIRVHKRVIDISKQTDATLKNLKNLDISAGVDVEVRNF